MELDNEIRESFRFNKFQTNITSLETLDKKIEEVLINEELDVSFTREVKLEFLEAFDSILFIKNLSAHDRKYARDLERWDRPYDKDRKKDPNGTIEVNLTNPHILEDMDYFRQAALTFQETGRYTHLYPNSNPYSEYAQFWKEEARRCREGMMRPSDGEWIPGYLYFYWNYGVIKKVVKNEETGIYDRPTDFPNPYDGDYIFFHYLDRARKKGRHTATLKKRGCGFSFKGGSKLARNFIFGETSANTSGTKSFAVANEKEYLTKDGVLNKYLDMVNFCAEHTPFPRTRELKDSINDMQWTMGYKDKLTNQPKGVQNSVMGVTLKNDPHRARGKRGILIEWEEVGSFSNFLTAWGVARPSVEEDGVTFGLMNAYGTGGEEGVDFQGLEEIFYSPKGYNILSMPNVFDKNTNGKTSTAFFFPQYLNVNGFYDKDGNSDVIGALISILVRRINVKYNTIDPNAIVQEKAERPITPQEAIMRTEGSAFPTGALKELLEEIKPNYSQFISEHWVGDLVYGKNAGEIEFKPNLKLTPLRSFPTKDKSKAEGAIEIFEMPKYEYANNDKKKIRKFRYIAGCDPVDNDYTKDGSLASIFIFDTWTDRIVAEYTGRPVLASEFYDKCIMLCKFYNATLNYENNLKGLFGHFSNNNCLHLLCDTPQYLRDMELIGDNLKGNKAKGTRTTQEVIKVGKTLQREWMLSQNKTLDSDGEEVFYMNYEKIRSIAYIEECIAWNPDGNFDRVSAMDMVMIYRQDILRISNTVQEDYESGFSSEGDDFIDKNWNKFVSQSGFNPDRMNINIDGI